MSARIAINGFGRIGRNVLRAALARNSGLEVVAINDLASPVQLAQLLKFDSVLGRFPGSVDAGEDHLIVNGQRIDVLAEREPDRLPWRELQVDTVLESTGRFTAAPAARAHLTAGAARVLVSGPSDGADLTIAYGINHELYTPEQLIVSNASCTTNALAPLASVLHDLAGIQAGFMTTVHAYTQEQNLQDAPHRNDPRRARAAGLNIVPTSTGAARAIGLVLPELAGKLEGYALRVPVAVGSLVELNVTVDRDVDIDTVNAAYRDAAEHRLTGILEYSADPLVSTDIVGTTASSIYDSQLTRVHGHHVKVVGWYDNEWGFSNRVVDTLELITTTSHDSFIKRS
jgi:glyceraldehyde 3-phosphate dehydrogenase